MYGIVAVPYGKVQVYNRVAAVLVCKCYSSSIVAFGVGIAVNPSVGITGTVGVSDIVDL